MSITIPVRLSMREMRERKHQIRKTVEAKLGYKIGRRAFNLYLRQWALRNSQIPESTTEP